MKVCFLIWNTKKCGGHKLIFGHAHRLKKSGHQVKVISVLGGTAAWSHLPIEIEPFWKFDWFKKTEILIATFWPTAYLAPFMPAKKKFYLVQGWEVDNYRIPLLSSFVRLTFYLPLRKIYSSNFVARKVGSLTKDEILKIPNTIEDSYGEVVRKHSPSPGRILSVVSAYEKYKGLDLLVDLIGQLKKRHGANLHFVLVSFEKKPYSPLFDEFLSNISQERLIEEYQKASLFLAAPRVEGFFYPALEAMACGCPVVMTDSGGVTDYARDGYNCLLAQTPEEIVSSCLIEKVLDEKELREKLVTNGLETAKQFSWQESAKKLERTLFH